ASANDNCTQLISTIWQLDDKELASVSNLISIMRYSKGPNKGKIILPYLQQKACNYLSQSFYKHKSDYHSLQSSNLKLGKKNKKLDQKNNELIKRTQSLGAKTQHLKE
ncbi:43053_t:CDS:1, partial [Gigaspora margarita]